MKFRTFIRSALFLIVAFTIGCTHTTRITTNDGFFITKSTRNHSVTYQYRLDSTLRSVRYEHGLGIMDSVRVLNENKEVTYRGVRERETTDSIFLYDKGGVLVGSRHYPGKSENYLEQPVKQVTYWPNGIRDSVLYITRVDTIETPSKNLPVINIDYKYSGQALKFDESGKLMSRGPYEKSRPSGIWVYYDEQGTEQKRDTL